MIALQAFAVLLYYVYVAFAPMNKIMMQGLVAMSTINTCGMIFQVIRMLRATRKILGAARRDGKISQYKLSRRHAFVIPNYKEDTHVLRNTLQCLAR